MNVQAVEALGRVGLFFGIETEHWTDDEWKAGAAFCKEHGVNFAIVKVFDAGNEWYGGQFSHIVEFFTAEGVKVLPYGFMGTAAGYNYNLDRDLPGELALCEKYMRNFGMVCGDMEGAGWEHRPDLGQKVYNGLAHVPGAFVASMPANPVDAGQLESFKAMAGVVSCWMPMAYNDHLSSVYKSQLSSLGGMIAPTFDLSQEFGPNNIEQSVTNAHATQVSFWEYKFAAGNTNLFDQCVKEEGSSTGLDPDVTQELHTLWNSGGFGSGVDTSGIYKVWVKAHTMGHYIGAPSSEEYDNVENGQKVVDRNFGSIVIRWPSCMIYGPYGAIGPIKL